MTSTETFRRKCGAFKKWLIYQINRLLPIIYSLTPPFDIEIEFEPGKCWLETGKSGGTTGSLHNYRPTHCNTTDRHKECFFLSDLCMMLGNKVTNDRQIITSASWYSRIGSKTIKSKTAAFILVTKWNSRDYKGRVWILFVLNTCYFRLFDSCEIISNITSLFRLLKIRLSFPST
jgi:hypothetical protein